MPDSDKRARLRDTLIEARRKQKLTQVEVALRLGKPQSFVSKYESGERRLDVIDFLDVCNALDITPTTVIKNFLAHP